MDSPRGLPGAARITSICCPVRSNVRGRLKFVPCVRLPLEFCAPDDSRSMCFTMCSCAQKRQRPVFIAIRMYLALLGRTPGAKNSPGGLEMMLYALFSCCRRTPVSFEKVCRARLIAIYMLLVPLRGCYVRRVGTIA